MSDTKRPVYYQDADACAEAVIEKVGKKIVLGIPLALGKPNQFVNAVYRRAKADPTIQLKIITALSLETPTPGSELERRIVEPMVERIFGDYPAFEYMLDLRRGEIPDNFELQEFYNKAGGFLNVPHAQQNYISTNYTHAVRDIMDTGINIAAQLVARKEISGSTMYSMSCNSDTPLEVGRKMREQEEKEGRKIALVGQINNNLPFMYGDAMVPPDNYDAIIDNPGYNFKLFGPPKLPVQTADHMVGLHASTLIQDGGTLQIGIGALGDAIVCGLQMRQDHNEIYNKVIREAGIMDNWGELISAYGGTDRFEEGLYGSTEMLVDGFLHLYKSGIIKRKVYDSIPIQRLINEKKISHKVTPDTFRLLMEQEAVGERLNEKTFDFLQNFGILKDDLKFRGDHIENGSRTYATDLTDAGNLEGILSNCLGNELKNGIILHGAFFIGPQDFYKTLNDMTEDERRQFAMTSVDHVNQLYNGEDIKKLQRKKARFINAGMMVNLYGAVTSDGYEDGRIVSGVGGQYNFVTMAHALEDARGVLMIKATRKKGEKVSSNIVTHYGHCTIPRHLRDIIVTEYGIADLRGKSDKDCAAAIINIADSRFQDGLLQAAKRAKKVPESYQIPERFKNNTPEKLEKILAPYKKQGYFTTFPFGTDLTDEELALIGSLRAFKEKVAAKKISFGTLGKAITSIPESAAPYLQRMQLDKPANMKEKVMQKIVVYALMSNNRI